MGGGHKQHYRIVDFKRNKDGIAGQGRAPGIRPEPQRQHRAAAATRTASAATSSRRKGVAAGTQLMSGLEAPIKPGNCLPLRNIPVGTTIHCIEMLPGKGAQMARSAGTRCSCWRAKAATRSCACAPARSARCTSIAAPTIGEVGNEEHSLRSIGKAGAKRWRGIRPTVRGVAMNPVDHPHGGGEGKDRGGRHPVVPWGTPTKGYKTRSNKRTDGMIVRRRQQDVRGKVHGTFN